MSLSLGRIGEAAGCRDSPVTERAVDALDPALRKRQGLGEPESICFAELFAEGFAVDEAAPAFEISRRL